MASRYWVGGTGAWNNVNTANWSATSGGAGGASIPVTTDAVFFDANSGTGTVTAAGSSQANCASLDCTGYAGTLSGGSVTPSGNVTLGTTGTYTGLVLGFFVSSVQRTMTSNGKTVNSLQVSGSGSGKVTLTDALTCIAALTLTSAAFDTNSMSVTAATFSSSNGNTRTFTMGSSSITLTGGATSWDTGNSTGLTITTNTATATLTGTGATFGGGAQNWRGLSLVISGTGTGNTIGGGNTFANVTRTGTASKTDGLGIGATGLTVTGTLTLTGNSATNRLLLQGSTLGTASTVTAANVVATNVDFQDITAAGAANWDLSASAGGSGDALGNTGITFTPSAVQYWRGNGGQWSDVTHWASTSGGAASSGRVPLPQDTSLFDANSFTSAAQTVNMDMVRYGTFDCTGATNTPTLHTQATWTSYGSMTLIAAMGWTPTNTGTFAGRGNYTITSAGQTFSQAVTVNAPGGTYTQGDAFLCTNNFALTMGTWNTANFALTVSNLLPGAGSGLRALNLGTSTVALTGTGGGAFGFNGATNLTINGAASTIVFTGAAASSFNGGAAISGTGFGTLRWAASVTSVQILYMSGANYPINLVDFIGSGAAELQVTTTCTLGTLSLAAGRKLRLQSGFTVTVTNWNVSGASGSLTTVYSSTPGSPATLAVTAGAQNPTSRYVSIQDITATGGSWGAMNSTNVSGNTGWTFGTTYYVRTTAAGSNGLANSLLTFSATSESGAQAAAFPTVVDEVVVMPTSSNFTTNGGYTYRSLTFMPGYAGTWSGGSTFSLGGNLTLNSTMTASYTGAMTIVSGNCSLTTAGKSLAFNVTVNNTSSVLSLQDALTSANTLTLTTGTITTNSYAVTVSNVTSSSTVAQKTWNPGSSVFTLTNSNQNVWNFAAILQTGDFTAATHNVLGSAVVFAFGGMNYGTLNFTGSGNITLPSTNNSCAVLRVSPSAAAMLILNSSLTVNQSVTLEGYDNGLTGQGQVQVPLAVRASPIGQARTLTLTGVTTKVLNVGASFSDINLVHTAGTPFTGTGTANIGDAGGNNGVLTALTTASRTLYPGGANGTTNLHWESPVNWWTDAARTIPAVRPPLPQDDVVIDTSTVGQDLTFATTSQWACRNLTMTSTTVPFTVVGNGVRQFFGSITVAAGSQFLTNGAGAGNITMMSTIANATWNLNGQAWPASLTAAPKAGMGVTLADGTVLSGDNTSGLLTHAGAGSLTIPSGATVAVGGFLGSSTALTGATMVMSSATVKITDYSWSGNSGTAITMTTDASTVIEFTDTSMSTKLFNSNRAMNGTIKYTVDAPGSTLSIGNTTIQQPALLVTGRGKTVVNNNGSFASTYKSNYAASVISEIQGTADSPVVMKGGAGSSGNVWSFQTGSRFRYVTIDSANFQSSPQTVYDSIDSGGNNGITFTAGPPAFTTPAYPRPGDFYTTIQEDTPAWYFGWDLNKQNDRGPSNRAVGVSGAPGYVTPLIYQGGATQYVGTDSVSFPGVAGDGTAAARSVEFWVKTTTTAGVVTARSSDFSIEVITGKIAVRHTISGGAVSIVQGAIPVNDNLRHHVVVTSTGNAATTGAPTYSIYVDGVLDVSAAVASSFAYSDTTTWYLGRVLSQSSGNWFVGTLDEMAYYTTALTPTQISTHYTQGLGSVGASLSRTGNDTLSGSDALLSAYLGIRTASDSQAASDTMATLYQALRAGADSVSPATDAALRLYLPRRTSADLLSLSDAANRVDLAKRTGADTISTTEAVLRLFLPKRQAADLLSGSDSPIGVKTFGLRFATAADSLTTTEAVLRKLLAARTVAETVTTNDADMRLNGFHRSAAEVLTTSDAVVRLLLSRRSGAEALSLSDLPVRYVSRSRTSPDSAPAVDSALRLFKALRTPSDVLSTLDAVGRSVTRYGQAADSLATLDAALRTIAWVRLAIDAAAVTDGLVSGRRRVGLTVDTAAATDALATSAFHRAVGVERLWRLLSPALILVDGNPAVRVSTGVYQSAI